jgi:hypothetical protein
MLEWMPLPPTTNERLAQMLERLLSLPAPLTRTAIRNHLAIPAYALEPATVDDLAGRLAAVLLVPTGPNDAAAWVKAHRDRTRSASPNGIRATAGR